jgi:hypothetical protein
MANLGGTLKGVYDSDIIESIIQEKKQEDTTQAPDPFDIDKDYEFKTGENTVLFSDVFWNPKEIPGIRRRYRTSPCLCFNRRTGVKKHSYIYQSLTRVGCGTSLLLSDSRWPYTVETLHSYMGCKVQVKQNWLSSGAASSISQRGACHVTLRQERRTS